MLHTTWSVNSLAHLWGYRNYETADDSRNNILVGILANGEDWHNNHHAESRSARHGHKWREFDLTWLTIRFLMLLGLAKNVALPSPQLAAKFSSGNPQMALDDAFLDADLQPLPSTVSSQTASRTTPAQPTK